MVLWFLAEGVDVSVLVRFTGCVDATIACWLGHKGDREQSWHNRLFRNLVLAVLQLDQLYTRVRGIASAHCLWLAIDPVSKVIPSLHIGGRTRDDAFALAHDIQQRLLPGHVPAFTSDGLRSYFYALTAHFGHWWRPPRARKDHGRVSGDLQHGMLIKPAATHPDHLHRARQPDLSPGRVGLIPAHLGLCPVRAPSAAAL
jgi:hypothetical protein